MRDGQVLQLPAAGGCDADRLVRIRFTPPAGAVFGWFDVSVRGRQRVRLTGIPRAASATVKLARGRSVVRVRGETLGGQRVDAERAYRTCAPPPRRAGAHGRGADQPGRRRGLTQASASARVGSGAAGSSGSGTSGVRATKSACSR